MKLDALEHVLKETNPLVHELYLGTIENLQAPKNSRSEPIAYPDLQIKAYGTLGVPLIPLLLTIECQETKKCLRQPRATTP